MVDCDFMAHCIKLAVFMGVKEFVTDDGTTFHILEDNNRISLYLDGEICSFGLDDSDGVQKAVDSLNEHLKKL